MDTLCVNKVKYYLMAANSVGSPLPVLTTEQQSQSSSCAYLDVLWSVVIHPITYIRVKSSVTNKTSNMQVNTQRIYQDF